VELKEIKEVAAQKDSGNAQQNWSEARPFKREWSRFEFALFINDFLICKRNFVINEYVDGSMQTLEFKNEVDKIVELVDEDLKSKSRVYTWYHNVPDHPDWEPEIMTDPLINDGEFTLRFVIYDNGEEVISRQWDARYYPSYVRKNIDLTNRQVKITKDDRTNIYDKEKFFADHGAQLSGDLYVLKCMISDKENLVPQIQKCIYEVCSSLDGYYENVSDYHTVVEYKNTVVKRDENGEPIYQQKVVKDKDGNEIKVTDAFGNPWLVPVLEKSNLKNKKYSLNIDAQNKRLYSSWGSVVAEKTRKYMSELYVTPKERFFKRKNEED
jgi:hypothetical protein